MLSVHPAPCEIVVPDRPIPRYCPQRALLAYRYVPGLHPHPVRDPGGHSFDPAPRARRHGGWDPGEWWTLADWLFGVDLFNAFFFWEAHEAWEGLWAVHPRDGAPAQLLQGLIQIAAALLKIHLGSEGGARSLSEEGLERLRQVARVAPVLLGLDVAATAAAFTHYFRPLLQRTLPPLDASVPLLLLSGRPDA